MFTLTFSVSKPLQFLTSALTPGGEGGHLFRLTCSIALWGGKRTASKYHRCVCGECSQCLGHMGFASPHSMCAFLVYTAQAPGCYAGDLSKAAPGLQALPRSKQLMFRFSDTPQSTDSAGPAFCALLRSEQLRRPDAW